jgi:hypothetical protein
MSKDDAMFCMASFGEARTVVFSNERSGQAGGFPIDEGSGVIGGRF